MRRVPLLAGSRITVATAPDDAVVLGPPAAADGVADVAAAVRDALRFPLTGEPLEALVPRGGRVTLLVEPPALPLPPAPTDPRQAALAAAVDELVRVGVPTERQTILVAAGLARRPGQRELESLVTPDLARRFRGDVVVHDVEDPGLVRVGDGDRAPRVHRTLVEADAVVVVSAAETVLHGGAAALLAASDTRTLRSLEADSLLETRPAGGWGISLALERALARFVPVIGVSLVLGHPGLAGPLRGFPYEREAVERLARSRLRRSFSLLPGPLRRRLIHAAPHGLSAAAAFAGPPSVAHAEALLRSIAYKSVPLDRPLDAICIGIPATTPYLPRERPNPLIVAHVGLALALRLWRNRFPLADGGTAILVHRFRRHFSHPTQQPYRAFFQAARASREPAELAAAEREAAADDRALEAYRSGRSCHPLLPFADWGACQPALNRLGSVVIAGCRDAHAARQLGFVPTHGIAAALAMASGRAGGSARVGFLLAPPYFPLIVAETGS